MRELKHQKLLSGLIRLHVLHHASKGPFYGQWMIEELAEHGYKLSPGTLYPLLHSLEKAGYLSSRNEIREGSSRRYYSATEQGRSALQECKSFVRELFEELVEDEC